MMNDNQQHQASTVLVIDDEISVREAVKDVLMIIDISVLAAGSGREGITLYEEKMAEIGLILLDLTLPDINGMEVLGQLRQLKPDVKVVLSSGYNSRDYMSAVDVNTNFLPKPYDIDQLIEKVQSLLP
jgi:DNA-binding NtrC family response regulator